MLKQQFPDTPIIALTATATTQVSATSIEGGVPGRQVLAMHALDITAGVQHCTAFSRAKWKRMLACCCVVGAGQQ